MLHINKNLENKLLYSYLLGIVEAKNMFNLGYACGISQKSVLDAYYYDRTIRTYSEIDKINGLILILRESRYKELENDNA